MPLQALLFDVGGVLRYTGTAVWEGMRRAIPSLSLSEEEVWHLRGLRELHPSEAFIAAYLHHGEELRELLELSFQEAKRAVGGLNLSHPKAGKLAHIYRRVMDAQSKAQPLPEDRQKFLQALRDRGLRLGIVSNASIVNIRRDLGEELTLFDVVMSRENIGERKPSPAGLRKALSALGLSAEEVLFVGDTEVDVLAANAAGVPFQPVSTGMLKAEWWEDLGFRPLSNLWQLLEEL